MVPTLVVALVLASGVAAAAYWPFPRPETSAPLVVSIDINRTSGEHPLSISVKANASGGTPPYSFSWTFGDGGNASTAGATHVYEERGIYQVLLRVTDQENRTGVAGATVTVAPIREHILVLNASAQTLGPGESKAWITPIAIPSTSISAWVNGSSNVTGCSLGGNCAVYVEILNAYDETNLTEGAAITNPIWCWGHNGSCQSNRTASVHENLEASAGQTIYLVLFNTDLVWSQSVSAQVWLDCAY